MDIIFYTGLIGSLILVLGAGWPIQGDAKHPAKSVKNWLFAFGGLVMLLYSILGWQNGGPIFFVFLEILVAIASIMMMIDMDDRIDTVVISISGMGFIIWSLYLFTGYNTMFFIIGLAALSMGYAFSNGTVRRDIALTFGSVVLAVFSYMEMSWIFFWLNIFFGIFSGYWLVKNLRSQK